MTVVCIRVEEKGAYKFRFSDGSIHGTKSGGQNEASSANLSEVVLAVLV